MLHLPRVAMPSCGEARRLEPGHLRGPVVLPGTLTRTGTSLPPGLCRGLLPWCVTAPLSAKLRNFPVDPLTVDGSTGRLLTSYAKVR